MNIDKTKQHFHLDIKFISQSSPGPVGKFVYVDNSGSYNLALSIMEPKTPNEVLKSNVQGVIWSTLNGGFYLKTSFGPLKYREPFGPDYFNKVSEEDNTVLEFDPNVELLPGDLGCKLWLSTTTPGELQIEESTILLGYKTSYGMLYRPEFVKCLKPPTV